MTKQTKTIEHVSDIHGFSKLQPDDQHLICTLCDHPKRSHDTDITRNQVIPTDPYATTGINVPQLPHFTSYYHRNYDRLRSISDLKATDVALRISGLGIAFTDVAEKISECGIDGRYIMSRTLEQFDEMLADFGVDDSNTGRQKRRRISYELGLSI